MLIFWTSGGWASEGWTSEGWTSEDWSLEGWTSQDCHYVIMLNKVWDCYLRDLGIVNSVVSITQNVGRKHKGYYSVVLYWSYWKLYEAFHQYFPLSFTMPV